MIDASEELRWNKHLVELIQKAVGEELVNDWDEVGDPILFPPG